MAKEQIYQPPKLPPLVRKSVKSGLITDGAVSENERPESSVSESINFDFDVIGSARVRKGLTRLGNALSGNILGMHYFVDTVNASPQTQMIVVNGSTAYYLSGGAWTSKRTGLTTGSKARFSTYLNFVFMVNGTEATAVWNGSASAFSTAGNALNAPTGTFVENFRSRMWIAGNTSFPSRVYYSSVPTSVATPVVTWNTDVTTGQWIDISPSDGDFMTGLQRFRNVMIVFKTNRLYRIFDINQTDADPYYTVGTSSMESVLETKVGVYFHHASGFFQYNVYGIVQEISRPIIEIIRAIPTSSYTSITGWVEPDGDHLCWSVGTVTIKGVTFTNLVLRYTISTMTWTHRLYPTQFLTSLRRQPLYNDGTTQFALVGDNSGNVYETNTGTDDSGVPISFSLVHGWTTIDGLLSTRKTIPTVNFTHYGAAGAEVAYQNEDNDPDSLNDWSKKIGTLKTINTGFNSVNIKARKFRFRMWGQSKGQQFVYNGFEMLDVLTEFIQFNN